MAAMLDDLVSINEIKQLSIRRSNAGPEVIVEAERRRLEKNRYPYYQGALRGTLLQKELFLSRNTGGQDVFTLLDMLRDYIAFSLLDKKYTNPEIVNIVKNIQTDVTSSSKILSQKFAFDKPLEFYHGMVAGLTHPKKENFRTQKYDDHIRYLNMLSYYIAGQVSDSSKVTKIL